MLFMVLSLSSCQTISERSRANELQDTLSAYESTIRWGALVKAQDFRDPEKPVWQPSPMPDRLRVTHYEVIQGPSMLEEDKAVQTALIQYVFENEQVVREVMDQQIWRYNEELERWLLDSDPPDFN